VTTTNKSRLIATLVSFSIACSACSTAASEQIDSEAVERSSSTTVTSETQASTTRSTTTTTLTTTTVTADETTTTESETTSGEYPDNFGGNLETNTVADLESSFAWLVKEGNKDRSDRLFIDLPLSERGDFEGLSIAYYPVSDGIFFGASHDKDDVITAYGLFFDPDDDNFAQFLSTFLSLSLPNGGPAFSERLAPFMQDPGSELLTDQVGENLVEVERAGTDPVSDPVFVLSVVSESSSIDHLDVKRGAECWESSN